MNTQISWEKGLYNEVVTEDCYKINKIDFIPSVVIDLGANIGVFSSFIRSKFPECKIIAVEPDADNYKILQQRFGNDKLAVLINNPIGTTDAPLYKELNSGGTGAMYYNSGEYFIEEIVNSDPKSREKYLVTPVTLPDLLSIYTNEKDRILLKVDIEGNECIFFNNDTILEKLKNIDYICMEIHLFASNHELVQKLREQALEFISKLNSSHFCRIDGNNDVKRHIDLIATKRQ